MRTRSNCLIKICDSRRVSRSKPTMPNPQAKQLYSAANTIAAIGSDIIVSRIVNPRSRLLPGWIRKPCCLLIAREPYRSIFTVAPDSSARFLLTSLSILATNLPLLCGKNSQISIGGAAGNDPGESPGDQCGIGVLRFSRRLETPGPNGKLG